MTMIDKQDEKKNNLGIDPITIQKKQFQTLISHLHFLIIKKAM